MKNEILVLILKRWCAVYRFKFQHTASHFQSCTCNIQALLVGFLDIARFARQISNHGMDTLLCSQSRFLPETCSLHEGTGWKRHRLDRRPVRAGLVCPGRVQPASFLQIAQSPLWSQRNCVCSSSPSNSRRL